VCTQRVQVRGVAQTFTPDLVSLRANFFTQEIGMNKFQCVALAGALSLSLSVFADGGDLVKEKQCLQCHDVGKDVIGPSFKRIAFRWKGNPTAEKMLISTIQNGTLEGGGQHWSSTTHMPNAWERPVVSKAEAKTIFQWIMRQ
jgi:cytochrome c